MARKTTATAVRENTTVFGFGDWRTYRNIPVEHDEDGYPWTLPLRTAHPKENRKHG